MPAPTTPEPNISKDLEIPMPDGAVLLADLYTPRDGSNYPTVLVRSPYGRQSLTPSIFSLPFAERGYNVLCQSARGTAGSGGDFIYARHEHQDGLATIEWIKKQAWFNGQLVLAGGSYLGFVQWAVAAFVGPELKALAPTITSSDFNHFRFQGGTLALEAMLVWSTAMTESATTGSNFLRDLITRSKRQKKLDEAYNYLPLKEADRLVIGKPSETYQDILAHGPEDPYWQAVDWSHTVGEVDAPIDLATGWYDLFLYWQLLDYRRLREAGKKPYLLIGPWFHGQFNSVGPIIKENLAWFDAQVKGKLAGLRKNPVRLFVMGANEWRDFADWPPPAQAEKWYLQPYGGLAKDLPPTSKPDHYRYNPANPTPEIGSGSNSLSMYLGPKDNQKLEARADVLVYTSGVLNIELEIIGPLQAELYVRSSLEHIDFFTRLCVVEKSGKSLNLCDGIIRLDLSKESEAVIRQEDGSLCVKLEIWPTAYRFKPGQRIRLQVSSGAHPRFPRNPGSGERLGEETILKLAEQTVYHDPVHPSSITLPKTSE